MSEDVVNHYQQPMLFSRIRDALKAQGKDLDQIQVEDLWPVDQFHIGGAGSTLKLLNQIELEAHHQILDVGCGIGGPCRLIAYAQQCHVTGIDLTPKYVETAERLSKLVRLENLTDFQVADALNLPFDKDSFDAVWTQHAQMNIEDKAALYKELVRVLKPGGRLIYHDIFQGVTGNIAYPTPWSEDGSISFLFTHKELGKLLSELGLSCQLQEDETNYAIRFFEELLESLLEKGTKPLGLHLVMGADAPIKIRNLLQNLTNGSLQVHQGVYEKISG